VCAPDFVFHSPNWPNWPRGIEGARKLATYGSQLYRDVRTTIDDIIAEHDRVAIRWTITGIWIGPERPGSPPPGQEIAVGSMSWYRFVEGKIVEDWGTEVFWPTETPESEIEKWRGTR
jgi:predicted ester cyclase